MWEPRAALSVVPLMADLFRSFGTEKIGVFESQTPLSCVESRHAAEA